MIVQEIAGLKIAFGENPKRIHSHGNNDSITRMGIMGMLREAFYQGTFITDNPEGDLRIAPTCDGIKKRNSCKNSRSPC